MGIKRSSCLSFGLVLVLGLFSVGYAQTWPSKTITMVVPSATGGSTDFMARILAEPLGRVLGQTIIVENKPGASGNIGTVTVARAAPDGYTLLMQYSGYHVGNPALFSDLQWNPTRDFVPVALVMRAPHIMVVPGSMPVNSFEDLTQYGQGSGKGILYASSGNGSIQHIAGELLSKTMSNVKFTHVPYKGAGPVVTDLISGRVDIFITTPPSVIGHINSGKLKGLAYTASKRHPSMPNIPTSAEFGLPGYEVESWFAVFAPAKTPPEIVTRLTNEIKKIVESEDFRNRVDEQGAFALYMSPDTLGKFVDSELAAWAKVIKEGSIKPE